MFVLRSIIAIGAALVLSLAFLSACEDMAEDDTNGTDDDTETAEETATPEDDEEETATPEDDAETETPEGDESDETATPEEGEADETATPEDDEAEETATPGDGESEETATPEDDDAGEDDAESGAGDAIEVTLVDYEIEADSTIEGGNVVFDISNEGESMHGLAVERTVEDGGEDDGEVEILNATTLESGESSEMEVELEPGDYTLFCPVGEHRDEEGMEMELTVE